MFDYVSASEFKFAGLDAGTGRWVIGHYTEPLGWHVPDSSNHRAVANVPAGAEVELSLVINGNSVELWAKAGDADPQRVLTKDYSGIENIDGLLGIGGSSPSVNFKHVRLATAPSASGMPSAAMGPGPEKFTRIVFEDTFERSARPEWRPERGVWRIDDSGDYQARSLAIELGDWLLVDTARIKGTIDVQFNDNNLLIPPPLSPTQDSSEGSVSVGLKLDQINALAAASQCR